MIPSDELKNTGTFPKKQLEASMQSELHQRGIRTLCDFVDEDSIGEVLGRAEVSFSQLKVLSYLF